MFLIILFSFFSQIFLQFVHYQPCPLKTVYRLTINACNNNFLDNFYVHLTRNIQLLWPQEKLNKTIIRNL